MITETRRAQLLAGYSLESIAAGDKPLWTDVRSAPRWAQDRIVEIRSALAENRPVPASTREYIQAAERRAAAATTFQRGAARFKPIMPSAAELAAARGRIEDQKLRDRLEAQGRRIHVDEMAREMGLK